MNEAEWKVYQAEKLKKWLEPVRDLCYDEADDRYNEFIADKKDEADILIKEGIDTSSYSTDVNPSRRAGFRAQKWFAELLWDFGVKHGSDLKRPKILTTNKWLSILDCLKTNCLDSKKAIEIWRKLRRSSEINYDITIDKLGPIEIKLLPLSDFKESQKAVNIKKASWDTKPSAYLVVIEQLDKNMQTFRLLGWLYGYQVFGLEVEDEFSRRLDRPAYYFCPVKILNNAADLLEKILSLSKERPIN